ncbi:MAG: hypothetical protein HETSPECPRED_007959 [Heterodermia speciosa]|uniref:Peptidase S8/S53 domain-containing protein n=1 Tax=Heterodermia speciosa TaxID=116794 RepID=A0A8H3ELY0_9LECA|nr:MAG: hypothetical protein HETSPECPRED_007959 [Heterodermia speciosa]
MNAKDPVGHGAHVCGSVCVSSIYTIPVLEKDISVKGTAPAAKLMMQAMSNHHNFVILIAAGNDADEKNHGVSQVGDNSAAKNCITAGATSTSRSNDGAYYNPKKLTPGITDTAVFSSRGPTKSILDSEGRTIAGRIKSDVVAPGFVILSAVSRCLATTDRVRSRFGRSGDKD